MALVPPLATVGVAWEINATEQAIGALLLYSTNLIAIVLSASVVMLVSGFVPDYVRDAARGRIGLRLLPWVIALIVIALPLAAHTRAVIEDEAFVRYVVSAVAEWDPQASVVDIDADRNGGDATVSLTVGTTAERQPAWELAKAIADDTGVQLDLAIRYQEEATDAASTS